MKECKAIQQLGNSSSFISGITRAVKATPPPAWFIGMFELEESRLFDLCLQWVTGKILKRKELRRREKSKYFRISRRL